MVVLVIAVVLVCVGKVWRKINLVLFAIGCLICNGYNDLRGLVSVETSGGGGCVPGCGGGGGGDGGDGVAGCGVNEHVGKCGGTWYVATTPSS